MSKADEMFEELEYKKIVNNNFAITYEYEEYQIQFGLSKQTVEKSFYNSELNTYNSVEITMQELQAINEKVKELQWI